jgi:small subunit ribosomal protein S6
LDTAPREYELVLMIDPGLEESARDQLASDARGQIEGGGTLKHENAWGLRKMAYEIRQRTEADYRWYRFEAPRELLPQLDHNLKIADGVLRFRIFKVDPESAVVQAPPAHAAPARSDSRDEGRGAPQRAAAPAAAPAATATAEAPPAAEEAPAAAEETPAPEESPSQAPPAEAPVPAEAPPAEAPPAEEPPAEDAPEPDEPAAS